MELDIVVYDAVSSWVIYEGFAILSRTHFQHKLYLTYKFYDRDYFDIIVLSQNFWIFLPFKISVVSLFNYKASIFCILVV